MGSVVVRRPKTKKKKVVVRCEVGQEPNKDIQAAVGEPAAKIRIKKKRKVLDEELTVEIQASAQGDREVDSTHDGNLQEKEKKTPAGT